MRYFQVEKEIVEGAPLAGVVDRSGEFMYPPEASEPQEIKTITTGFSVFVFDENGLTEDVEFYPVETNFGTFENNEEEVLNKIEAEHPAGEWQCNEW